MQTSRLYSIEGIILKRKNIGEADRLLTIFSKQVGKLTVLAKGVRKISSRRAGHLEILSHVVVSLHKGRWKDIVIEARKVPQLANQMSIDQLSYCYFLCELVDRLLPELQEHQDVFFMLVNALENIRNCDNQLRWEKIVNDFAIQLLRILGFLSDTKKMSLFSVIGYIEQLSEKKIKAAALLTKLAKHE